MLNPVCRRDGVEMKRDHNITGLLLELNNGSPYAYDLLFPLVYDELQKIAEKLLFYDDFWICQLTFSKTDLVHETYLKMGSNSTKKYWESEAHFFRIACRCMRSILIDDIRKKTAEKRGGSMIEIEYLDHLWDGIREEDAPDNIHKALRKLKRQNKRMVKIVELRYLLGLNINETARLLNISASTVKRDWIKARKWLYKELTLSKC